MLKQRLIIIFAISIIGSSYADNWFESQQPGMSDNQQFKQYTHNPEATNNPRGFLNTLIHKKTDKYQSGKPYTFGQEVSEPCANLHAHHNHITITKTKHDVSMVIDERSVSKKEHQVLDVIQHNKKDLERNIHNFLDKVQSVFKTCSTPSTTGRFPQADHPLNLSAMTKKIQSCKPGMVGIKGGSGDEHLVVHVGEKLIALSMVGMHFVTSSAVKHEVILALQHLLTSLINQCEKKLAHPVGF